MTNHFSPEDLFSNPKSYTDPDAWHAEAARLRREDPVCRIEAKGFDPFWAVTRHADLLEVERQPALFLNTLNSVLLPKAQREEAEASGAMLKTLISMDGEEHRAYRNVTVEWFKPASLRQELQPRVTELAKKYVGRMAELGGECDFALDIARYYPLQVIMSILGVPESDELLMLDLTQKLFGAEDPDFGVGDDRAARMAVVMNFIQYFARMTEERRANPGSDLASTIANGRLGDGPLGPVETIGYYIIVATAGHDTTSSTLAGGLEALARDPEQLRALQRDPSLLDNAVEEMIRWVTPVRHFLRYAQQDYGLRGKKIAKGDVLMMSYLSANRDEEVFANPFKFDVTRTDASNQLAFGTGVHFCLGANLARMELRTFFEQLLPRLESLELTGATEYTAATFVGAPKRVPIRYRLK